MRYLGSKETLSEDVLQLLREKNLLVPNLVFCDAFCGMGSIANAVKSIYGHIIINDSLKCSSTYTFGRLVAGTCNFPKLGFNPFEYLNKLESRVSGFIYHNYSQGGSERMYFTPENAGRIDFFRGEIEHWFSEGLINNREYSYLLACLLEAVSKVANTAGVYGAFLKKWDNRALKPIQIIPIDDKTECSSKIDIYNSRIEEIILQIDCDILYLDPPYTQNQYGTQYHLLETIILDDSPSLSKITGSRPTAPMRSLWSKKYHAHILLDKIVAETSAKHIILSYSQDGLMSKEYIEATLKRYGVESSYSCKVINYKKYNNHKSQKIKNHCEYLFYIYKKESQDVLFESPLNYTGSKTKMIKDIQYHLPSFPIETFVDLFGGGFNVGVNMDAYNYIYNDINPFVTELIKSFKSHTYDYLLYVSKLIQKFQLSPGIKEGYLELRKKYNAQKISDRDPRMLYTLILYGFQQQIRFNSARDFNNPVGSRWFNEKLLSKFVAFSRRIQTLNIKFQSISFSKLEMFWGDKTFVYADPPYRSTLGVYNDGKRGFEGWTLEHERSLCTYLDSLHLNEIPFMLSYVIKVGDFYNQEIVQWATKNGYSIIEVASTQGRYNNRKEVLIINY
jgi:adenine-specific methyltransferase